MQNRQPFKIIKSTIKAWKFIFRHPKGARNANSLLEILYRPNKSHLFRCSERCSYICVGHFGYFPTMIWQGCTWNSNFIFGSEGVTAREGEFAHFKYYHTNFDQSGARTGRTAAIGWNWEATTFELQIVGDPFLAHFDLGIFGSLWPRQLSAPVTLSLKIGQLIFRPPKCTRNIRELLQGFYMSTQCHLL